MTLFETLTPFLTGALVILTAVLGWFCIRLEKRLAGRKSIDLATYKEKSNLFYILNDIPVAVITGAAAAMTAVLTVAALVDPVIRIYAIVLGLLLPVDGVVLYLTLSRKKCGRDIRQFDSYYVQVDNMLARKDRTLSDIRVCQKRVDELRDRLTQTIRDFNKNLAEGLSVAFVHDLFEPIDRMIGDYVAEVDRFSVEVERTFNAALQEFLLNETVPELCSVPLRHFDETAVDDLLDAIKASYGDRIAVNVVEQVNRGAVKSARAIGNIMSLLHKLEVQMDKETVARFLQAAARFNDRAELAALLHSNRQISAATVRETLIPENWEWIFTPNMASAYNRRELTAILTDLLVADKAGMCHRLLVGFNDTYLDVLDAALNAEETRAAGESNSACRMAKAHRLILSKTYAVGNSGNLYENIGYMLFDRRDELGFAPDVQERIAAIVQGEQFYAARRELLELHGAAVAYGAPLVNSTTRVLLLYIMSEPANFLDPSRLAGLFGEYRKTLSFSDIAAMRALLCAWLLLTSKDQSVIVGVLGELGQLPYGPLAAGTRTPADAQGVARAILTHLTQTDRMRLRTVVYRTESERRMLDRILML